MNYTKLKYCIQRDNNKTALIMGGQYETIQEAQKNLREFNKRNMLKGFMIVKRLIHIPEPPTEEEKEFMKAFSKGINEAIKESGINNNREVRELNKIPFAERLLSGVKK